MLVIYSWFSFLLSVPRDEMIENSVGSTTFRENRDQQGVYVIKAAVRSKLEGTESS